MNRYILDTSFIISYLAPDEKSQEVEEYFEEYYLGFSKFYILELTYYKVLNSLRTMVIQK